MAKQACSTMIPEERRPIGSEMVEVETGRYEKVVHYEDIPEHPCANPATVLSRDLEEVRIPGMHGSSWKVTEDRAFCEEHAIPGTVRHLDGRVTKHATMALDDA